MLIQSYEYAAVDGTIRNVFGYPSPSRYASVRKIAYTLDSPSPDYIWIAPIRKGSGQRKQKMGRLKRQ